MCGGDTGHAEVVHITFDPAVVSFKELLEVFFVIHDPTTLNRQGNDVGTQYRSAIFYHTPEQKTDAEEVIARLECARSCGTAPSSPSWRRRPPSTWPRATIRNTSRAIRYQPYCQVVVAPKVAKFRKHFLDKLKKT